MPKVREAIKLIEADGWQELTTKGSHRQFKHRVSLRGQSRQADANGDEDERKGPDSLTGRT